MKIYTMFRSFLYCKLFVNFWCRMYCTYRMCPANGVGSSKLKAVVKRDVSKRSQIRSFTVLSDLSADVFFFNSFVMECV